MQNLVELVTQASLNLELVLKHIDKETGFKYHDELFEAQYALEQTSRHLAENPKTR